MSWVWYTLAFIRILIFCGLSKMKLEHAVACCGYLYQTAHWKKDIDQLTGESHPLKHRPSPSTVIAQNMFKMAKSHVKASNV